MERWDEECVERAGKTRTKKAGGCWRDNLEVERLTINQGGCWFNPQIFQPCLDNYTSLEKGPDAPKLVQGFCAEANPMLS